MSIKNPDVIILLGPVGAGKSTVGRLMADQLKGHFISIEEFFMQRYGGYEAYAANKSESYKSLEKQIRDSIRSDQIPTIFEEIAISPEGKRLVDSIQSEFKTNLICVNAGLETCKQRVLARGTNKNFPKTDVVVESAWKAFDKGKSSYKFKAEIQNEHLSLEKLTTLIQEMWPLTT